MSKKSVSDVFNTLNDEQKQVFYYLLGCAVTSEDKDDIVKELKECLRTDMEDILLDDMEE